MSKPMTDERLGAIKERCEKATPGPWAWEDYGEKENCFRVGIALDKHDNELCGHVRTERYVEDEDDPNFGEFVEDVIWRNSIGDMEGATVNYDDAEFIAHAREDVPALLEEIRLLREENEQLKQDLREARSEAALIAKASEKLREENERLKAACESTYKWQMRARELLEQLLLHIDPGLDLTVVKEARAFLGDNK